MGLWEIEENASENLAQLIVVVRRCVILLHHQVYAVLSLGLLEYYR